MQWLKVFLAGLVEVIWVTGLNKADSLFAWLIVAIFIVLSFYLVIAACKTLPVGTVYAVFVGMGTIGTVLVDIFFFHEPFSLLKLILIALLIIGIIGLKLTTTEGEA
ncbi:MAG TPA: QacE family quaternary ammonium compound efflux SMR transporter [Staphylococcus kloosii]|jgi:paired small multidrug resistance pump|uniref:QacE family quaternary ammonium compound efflux SMR transporter n=1 Tax=Staphylococcus kloosii TaxID=29384 RepID=A0A921KVV2_9STAP|nr:SMR family transporter [Staphylococcus kloosii]AVQ35465.1 QacE family quaternary ammonium compound efflux SMR transporter [Staphylococcus kloosii]MBF7030679.1 QacE family quaternary ammonium compound efflux SMR transporter [Staphylococcus kloosii]MCD8879938.1 QacE family quaternary ammonium compound efflux SMR transporter [Staphylococcus kloosii]PNZ04827.1 QacE family quaternary ammonium compound efflux SMR transporter [Staphylococcus kloosii]SUM48514.1 SMR-type multidrug efflux transporter